MPRRSVQSALRDGVHKIQQARIQVDLVMNLILILILMVPDLYDVMYDVMLVGLGLVGRIGDVGNLLPDERCMAQRKMNWRYGLVELRISEESPGGNE
jgi:hypothetical protein